MADLLPKGGTVYAVDHWLGSAEHQSNPTLATLYQRFLSNVIHAGLTDKIVPVQMDSLKAAECFCSWPCSIDLIYIDASHDEESVYKDLIAWYPFVEKNGILCGDDWSYPSVQAAVVRFAEERRLVVTHSGNFWRLGFQPENNGTGLKDQVVKEPTPQKKPRKNSKHKQPRR